MIVDLHNAVAAVCPIHGVSIGSESDPSTWMIDFRDDASEPQRAAAAQALAAFDPLVGLKRGLSDTVQSEFDAACEAIITPGSAMASVYRVQVDAAYRLIAGAITTHPALASLVGVLGSNEADVAQIIASRNEQCEAAISDLNRKRLMAKALIDAAQTADQARAAASVAWW